MGITLERERYARRRIVRLREKLADLHLRYNRIVGTKGDRLRIRRAQISTRLALRRWHNVLEAAGLKP